MSVKVREQRGKLYLDIYHNGVRKWESLHLTLSDDKKQDKELYRLAEICRSKREAQLLSGDWDIKADGAGRTTLVSYARNYAKHLVNQNPMTSLIRRIEKYENGATIQIGQVTPKWIEGFQSYLLSCKKPDGNTLSQSSTGTYMKLVRAIFRKAAAEGTLSRDPSATVAFAKVPDPDMVFLSMDEVRKLSATVPDSDFGKEVRRAFLFGCFTGLRVSDIETLTWGMIEKDPPQIIKRQKKTGNPVYIPLNKNAQNFIFDGKEHGPEECVFSLAEKKCRNISYRKLKQWAVDAGIKKRIGWHTARRTFATLALGHGADAVTVARLLGHTGLGQVMKYAKATDEMKRRAVDAMPELE
ncbi:MAG: site-specific integrase [Treponema sp.]|nr:site-specific integrase [Treponema sp.]